MGVTDYHLHVVLVRERVSHVVRVDYNIRYGIGT